MILSWMLYTLLVGALLSLAAIVGEWAFRTTRLPLRLIWSAAIAFTLMLSVSAPFREQPAQAKSLTLNATLVTDTTSTREMTTAERVRANLVAVMRSARNASLKPMQSLASSASKLSPTVTGGIEVTLFVSTALSLFVLIVAYVRFATQRRAWPRANLHGAVVRVAPKAGPAVMGIAPPEIVVPQWVLSRTAQEQKLMLAHESEHVRAHDPLLLMAGCVAVALAPWNAALWFMWSRLRLATEMDCDRRVLRSGAPTPAYGMLLVELSEMRSSFASRHSQFAAPAFAGRPSHLEQRLLAMTARPASARHRLLRRLSAISVATFALVAACESRMPTAAELSQMDATKIADKLDKARVETDYTVDGKRVTESEAKAIPAERIEGISVAMDRKAFRRSVVNIRLKEAETAALAAKSTDGKQLVALSLQDTSGVTRIVADTLVIKASGNDSVTFTARGSIIDGTATDKARVGISRRNGSMTGDSLIIVDGVRLDSSIPKKDFQVSGTIKVNNSATKDAPLVVIDGVEGDSVRFNTLDPSTISTVEVIKGEKARQLYGDRAINGVIIIKTRK